jgi:hypothetical protein
LLVLEARPPALREGMAAPAPPVIRLRQFLKQALRAFGFVCVEARELPAGESGARALAPGRDEALRADP